MYRLKYEIDLTVIPILADKLATLCRQKLPMDSIDRIVPVPPSNKRDFDPVLEVAGGFAERLPISLSQLLAKSRTTSQQKELTTLVQKEANVRGAFRVTVPVAGRSFLIVDDLYDSGATMREVFRTFRNEGAHKVYVLAITRTIHTDA